MPACEPRLRPSSRLVASLACAMLFGCAQLERASEPVPSTPAPTIPPSPAPPSSGDTAISTQQRGRISTYGNDFAGRKTASGELFDPSALTMAHRTLPFGTRVRHQSRKPTQCGRSGQRSRPVRTRTYCRPVRSGGSPHRHGCRWRGGRAPRYSPGRERALGRLALPTKPPFPALRTQSKVRVGARLTAPSSPASSTTHVVPSTPTKYVRRNYRLAHWIQSDDMPFDPFPCPWAPAFNRSAASRAPPHRPTDDGRAHCNYRVGSWRWGWLPLVRMRFSRIHIPFGCMRLPSTSQWLVPSTVVVHPHASFTVCDDLIYRNINWRRP